MGFARKVWHLLVAVKDGLSLVFLLLFFGLLYAALTARPSPAQIRDGALLLELDGVVVEEKSIVDPIEALLSGSTPIGEYQARDLVQAIEAAARDDRIKAIVLDMTNFLGGGQVHMEAIGAALERAKAAEKPVLTYATVYTDDGMMLAAHASEIWVDPLGGAIITGPGGSRLYYSELLEKLKINARVYKVGTYKSAVEPYFRNSMSAEARENYEALYGSLWEEWQASVKKARPQLQMDLVTKTPAEWIAASNGDLAQAALAAGMVDTLGSRAEFGQHVAEIVGEDPIDDTPGTFAYTDFDAWLVDSAPPTPGRAIGVVTIAGEIVDGDAGPGTAGGDRIAALLDEALLDDLAALVIRVDSPGGSVLASEEIRRAILRHKANDIPIAVSMANLAASGGYWVSTPGDRIFAEPETITGSIGIFAVVPTFEDAAAEVGVNADGVRTTPLSGQPDLVAGFTPEVDSILQSTIEDGYRRFLTRVAESRGMTTEQVDVVGQGRVWDGGTARQIGLVDQYGGIEDAIVWAAKQAELESGDWHVQYLGNEGDPYQSLIQSLVSGGLSGSDKTLRSAGSDLFGIVALRQQALAGQATNDLERLLGNRGMQVYCLECPVSPRAQAEAQEPKGWFRAMAKMLLQ